MNAFTCRPERSAVTSTGCSPSWESPHAPRCATRSKRSPIAATPAALSSAGRITYQYDALGRLIQASRADGTGVQYSYDPVGNITAIRRVAANTLTVTDFAPRSGAVDSVVRPLLGPSGTLPPSLYEPDRWLAHISLVSHELRVRADLREEVEDYVTGLGIMPPSSFTADTVMLYRFAHSSWTGSWWRDMRWEHVRSWRLA